MSMMRCHSCGFAVDTDDRLTLNDTFNRCCDEGWLKPWHDNRFDHSTAELTQAGRDALAAP